MDSEGNNFENRLVDAAADGLPEGSMMVGWATVMEFITPDGERTLILMDGTDSGEPMPEWQRDSYFWAGLKSGWNLTGEQ